MLVAALCHEIRNVSGAIGVVHSKLSREPKLAQNEDFLALGTLVQGLEKMAALELRQSTRATAESVDLRSVIEELRIIVEPWFDETNMAIQWDVPQDLPRIWADRQTLLQAFLNIAKNAQRAMEGQPRRQLSIRAALEYGCVAVRFIDSGPGVKHPEQLFQPFQPGAQASGLGLYLSRTFVRSFQGEIEYEPQAQGSCFTVTLSPASQHEASLETA
jgi:C4-dicarboxylate-specific signal transduction histidine kinase